MDSDSGKDYTEYKRCSNQLRNLTRKATKLFEKNISKNVKKQPKKFWRYVNSKRSVKAKIPDLHVADDDDPECMAKTDKQKANVLADFFSSVMTREMDGVMKLSNKPEIKEKLIIDINEDLVGKKLSKLKISKSPGPDTMHPRVLKELKLAIVKPLTMIFQTSLETGRLPEVCKQANITAIFKKGSKHLAGNYRPVSLTSVVCKLLESLIRDCLVKYMKNNGIFSSKQFGFIGGRSTVLQLLKVLDKWTEILDNGGCVDVIYCDFMKAFDTVPHNRLISVLEFYGVEGRILAWIKEFLNNRKQRVMVNGVPSSWHDVVSGIPQGSVLGPVLFVVYINTLVDEVDHSEVSMFADDTKMYKGIFQPPQDNMLLQTDIDNISRWSEGSLLKFHPEKTAAMRITRSSDLEPPQYTMNNKPLALSDEEKDLGVIIDSKLTFEKHIQAKINKANQIMGLIRRTIEYLNKENFKLLFTALVRPHLEYANAVWSPSLKKHVNALENVQRRATKYIPGLANMSYQERLQTLELPTLQYRRYRGDMIEVFKITHGLYDKCVTDGFLPMVDINNKKLWDTSSLYSKEIAI